MRDELYDRDFQQARSGMNDGIDRLIGSLSDFFSALSRVQHRVNWRAPWDRASRRTTGA